MPPASIRAPKKATAAKAKYRRIVLKISGEALKAKGSPDNISPEIVRAIGYDGAPPSMTEALKRWAEMTAAKRDGENSK